MDDEDSSVLASLPAVGHRGLRRRAAACGHALEVSLSTCQTRSQVGPFASRAVVVFLAFVLSACATSSDRPAAELPPPYEVVGSLGLVVTPDATPVRVRMPDNDIAVRIEADAEAKRKEARQSAGVAGLALLTAPLAIFAPLYPPGIILAAEPFILAGDTAKASEQASNLKEKAAQARRDAACAMQLANAEVVEGFRRALADQALRLAIGHELRDALSRRSQVSVTVVEARRDDESTEPFAFVKDAKDRGLPTMVIVDIVAIDLSAEAIAVEPRTCRYKIVATAELTWWDVDRHTLVSRSVLEQKQLPIAALDLPALLERPDQLRSVVARGFRDVAAGTFNVSTLKFGGTEAQP